MPNSCGSKPDFASSASQFPTIASDKRSVALLSCPIDGFLEGGEDVVCVVFCGDPNGIGLGAR